MRTRKSIPQPIRWVLFSLASLAVAVTSPAFAQEKPNILVIMSDDVGITNLSGYSRR